MNYSAMASAFIFKTFPRHTVNLSRGTLCTALKTIRKRQVFNGPCIKEFERKFADYHGIKYARAVFSARTGLWLILKALNFQRDDEIILSAFNYYEIPLLINISGLKPVFVDVEPWSFNIDISQIEKHITLKTKAILITHTFGNPCEMTAVMNIARKYNLKVIEDCAHACGAEYRGQKVGTFGEAGIFSFALGKNIPCFGGGAIITQDDSLWRQINTIFSQYTYPSISEFLKILLIHFTGYFYTYPKIFPYITYPLLRILDAWGIHLSSYHENLKGFSQCSIQHYQKRMINLQAAVGLRQLERLENINVKLRENALLYNAFFKDTKRIKIPPQNAEAKHIYLYYCFTVKNRELFRRRLLRKGIDIEVNHLSHCPAFEMSGNTIGTYPVSKMIAEESIDLPNNIYLTPDDIRYIADCVKEIIEDTENDTDQFNK